MKYIWKNKIINCFLFCVFSFLSVQGQNDLENHKKYWYYKSRLNNDFVKVGNSVSPNDHGESMPFNERGFEDHTGNYMANSRILKIGDGTTRLGIYLAVLATEYRLLKNYGQDVTKVKHEIFCALNAINRVDYYAESIFSNGAMAPDLNGFFIRDDIPFDFAKKNYLHFNYYNHGLDNAGNPNSRLNDKGFAQPNNYPTGQDRTISTYQDWVANRQLMSSEESQDQAYYLLMGLALTSKLVDQWEIDGANVFGYGSGETKLQLEAVNIADRIIKHISNSAGGLFTIRNPANGNAFVLTGDQAGAYAYPLDNSGCFIKYNQDLPYVFIPIGPYTNPLNSCGDYRNLYSATLAPGIWHLLAQNDGGPSEDEQGFFHVMAGVCNCVYEDQTFINLSVQQALANVTAQIQNLNNVVNTINSIYIAIGNGLNAIYSNLLANLMPSFRTNTTDQRLVHNNYFNNVIYSSNNIATAHLGSDAYFGIYLRDVLHPNTSILQLPSWLQFAVPTPALGHVVTNNDMQAILNGAPCQGNYREFPNVPSPYWGASNRLDRTDPLWIPNAFQGNQGEYAGTDYMLLHNLYYLREGTSKPIVNYSERNVVQNMPIGTLFSSSNKNTLGAFEFITASNIIASNGAADYRAGKEITLLPNFSAVAGSDFGAFISPFPCSDVGDNSVFRTANNSNSGDFYDGQTSSTSKPTNNSASESGFTPSPENPSDINRFTAQLDSIVKTASEKQKQFYSPDIELYPNPNNGDFNIEFKLINDEIVDVSIYDVLGNEVFSRKHISGYLNLSVSLKNLAKGVYMAKFINSSGIDSYKKLIIQ